MQRHINVVNYHNIPDDVSFVLDKGNTSSS